MGQADDTLNLSVGFQRNTDNATQAVQGWVVETSLPAAVVRDKYGLFRLPDAAAHAFSHANRTPQLLGKKAFAHAHFHELSIMIEQVNISVGGAGQRSGPLDDGFEQLFRVDLVEKAQGRLVKSAQRGVLAFDGAVDRSRIFVWFV
jgi:hypothetical protein